jgi:hypothetical protein
MTKTETNAIDCSAAEGERRPQESSVQPAVKCVDELIEHVKEEIREIESVLDWNRKIAHRGDSKLKFMRQVYEDQFLCWLNQLRDKLLQVEQGSETRSAG